MITSFDTYIKEHFENNFQEFLFSYIEKKSKDTLLTIKKKFI